MLNYPIQQDPKSEKHSRTNGLVSRNKMKRKRERERESIDQNKCKRYIEQSHSVGLIWILIQTNVLTIYYETIGNLNTHWFLGDIKESLFSERYNGMMFMFKSEVLCFRDAY